MSNRTLDALRRLSTGGLALLRTRVEYATLELSMARERILRWCVRGLVAAQLIQLALLCLTALVIALLWPLIGPWSLLCLALLFGGAAWWLLSRLVDDIEGAPAPLAETMRQLAEDQRAMADAFGIASPDTPQSAAEQSGPAVGRQGPSHPAVPESADER